MAKKKAEDAARLEKELKEEKEQQRKKRASEREAREEAAQQLMNIMGVSHDRALYALFASGYQGMEAAANWVLENPVSDEDVAAWIAEEKRKEEEVLVEYFSL